MAILKISKEMIFEICEQKLHEKIIYLQKEMSDLMYGLENDTKSSAGDKHETARAMMQIDYEKSLRQLTDANTQMTILKKINHHTDANVISAGSLIYTNHGAIFIAISLGKIKIEQHDVMVISPQSPLALKFMQAKKSSTISMNGIDYIIEKVE